MNDRRMPYLTSAYALVLPFMGLLLSGGGLLEVLVNWAILVIPQAATIALAAGSPELRRPYAVVTLWTQTILLLLIEIAAWLDSHEHIGLWIVSPAAGFLVMIAIGVYYRYVPRRSNNASSGR